METIFQFLGMILDDLSEGDKFSADWDNGTAILETNNSVIIDTRIVPLFGDEKEDERAELFEHCKWYYATVTISHGQIVEVGLGDDLDHFVSCCVSSAILEYLSTFKLGSIYAKLCDEITKKCEFLVDNDNMM